MRSGRGGGGRDEDRREDREDVEDGGGGPIFSRGRDAFSFGSDGGAAAAIVAEYALWVSGGGARGRTARVVAAVLPARELELAHRISSAGGGSLALGGNRRRAWRWAFFRLLANIFFRPRPAVAPQ